jgi:hypothetical protein
MVKITKNNCLSAVNPKLCEEWDSEKNIDVSPNSFSYGSKKKVWWKCSACECSWLATILNRNNGSKCPNCCGRIISEENSLAIKNPNLCKEWDYKKNNISPNNFFSSSHQKVWWICSKGHSWLSAISNRNKNNTSCPHCLNRIINSENCLSSINPDLTKEWHPTKNGALTPKDVFPNSNKKIWWKCKKGHEWLAKVNERSNGGKCRYCFGRGVDALNCLSTLNPELSKEWHPTKNGELTPNNVRLNSSKKAWWKCSACNFEWQTTISSRSHHGNGCPKCQKVIINDGTECDSYVEAYFYLKFKEKSEDFFHHKVIKDNDNNFEFDFYFPLTNTYVEVTGYTKKNCKWWNRYVSRINKKRKYIKLTLGANFIFIKKELSTKNKQYVIENTKR